MIKKRKNVLEFNAFSWSEFDKFFSAFSLFFSPFPFSSFSVDEKSLENELETFDSMFIEKKTNQFVIKNIEKFRKL